MSSNEIKFVSLCSGVIVNTNYTKEKNKSLVDLDALGFNNLESLSNVVVILLINSKKLLIKYDSLKNYYEMNSNQKISLEIIDDFVHTIPHIISLLDLSSITEQDVFKKVFNFKCL